MTDNVIRISDAERKSRNPDAATPRDPCDADVIILPVVRRLNAPAPDNACTSDAARDAAIWAELNR